MDRNSSPSPFKKILNKLRGENKVTTINLLIRGVTLAGKFLLSIFLATYLTEEQMGVWGIFTTSIALSLYLVGLDFYTYSTRTILDFPLHERGKFIRDQFIFYMISYIILFPLLSLLFVFNVIEPKLIIFFYIILVFEHLAQEAYRTFVVFSKPVWANIILFLRTGLWTYLLLIIWFIGIEDIRTLKTALIFWICGGAFAIAATIYFLSKLNLNITKNTPVNWKWIKAGIRVSLVYFMATICFKLIELSDRYFLLAYDHSKEMVGIYTFYANMANLIEIFVHTTTIIMFSPILIDTFLKDKTTYLKTFSSFAKNIVVYNIIALGILAAIMYPVLVYIVRKQSYIDHIDSFIVLIAAEMLFNLSLIFHYILYVRKNDTSVVKATIAAAFTNILLNFIFIPQLGINGAALSTFLSFLMLLVLKAYYSRGFPETLDFIFLKFLRKNNQNDR